jgi:hypothetical protein
VQQVKKKRNWARGVAQWWSPCRACARPYVQPHHCQKKKKKVIDIERINKNVIIHMWQIAYLKNSKKSIKLLELIS